MYSLLHAAKGKDAVIIGMGPSFRMEDVDRFEGYLTFACNKIYLMGDEKVWRPDYYCVSDILVARNNVQNILEYTGPEKFIHPVLKKEFTDRKSIGVLPLAAGRNFEGSVVPFPSNPLEGIVSGGGTVLVALIQMARWAGCKNIYVIGVDHSFEGGRTTKDVLISGDKVVVSEGENNHFHPDYRKEGETWTAPKYDIISNGFRYCRDALKLDGIRLVNASRFTKLEVLERIPFDEQFPPIEN